MTIFRLANDGMLPYDDVFLVEGQPRVDKYTLEDLQPFDAVILYGHDYKNSRKAWETLAAYVETGGSLYVDTGWEFWIPEWEFEEAPGVLPIRRLTWTDYGMASGYNLEAQEIAGEVDVSQFKPLIWEGQPWTLSGAEISDVKDWARVVLSAAGNPLIVAGEYGEGRVVWSGMNLISHARYLEENEEELRLIRNLLDWLTEKKGGNELSEPDFIRDHPDRVEFLIKPVPNDVTWLYWREAYYPNWRANLVESVDQREIPIYRAGPGFMLIPIDTTSDNVSIRLEWKPSLVERAAIMLSLLGVILVVAHVIDGLFLGGNGLTWIKVAVTMLLPKPILDEKTHEKTKQKKPSGIPSTISDQIYIGTASPSQENIVGRELDEGESEDGTLQIDVPPEMADNLTDESLLKSWLDEANEPGDSWARKTLGRKKH